MTLTSDYASHIPWSSTPWLRALQSQGQQAFERFGFPTRDNEAWKYSSPSSFLKQSFQVMSCETASAMPAPLPLQASNVQVSAGRVLASSLSLPKGVLVMSLQDALISHAEMLQTYLGTSFNHEHGFEALNTAMLQHGVLIYVPQGVVLSEPLCLRHDQALSNQAVHLRHLVVLEEDSVAHVVEDYHGDASTCYFTNTLTEVFLAKGASLTHSKIQREGALAYHVGHVVVKQAAKSCFTGHLMSFGGHWSRNDTTVFLEGEGASCRLNGVYTPTDRQHMDQHTRVVHTVPHCRSDQDYRGLLMGQSRAVFDGRVIVEKQAQHTYANQQNKNVLLSKLAEVDTCPQLLIDADDVKCSHGATVGPLDEEALFYLATRGFKPEHARAYLIQAFVAENLCAMPYPSLVDWLTAFFATLWESVHASS